MAYRHMRYPGGKSKAVTFSYDDGSHHDLRLAEIINRYGIKCTFNVNTAYIAEQNGQDRLSDDEIRRYLLAAGHEVAVHGHEHMAPGLCTPVEIIQDVLKCRLSLEQRFERIIRGMAYPDSGITNTAVTPFDAIKRMLQDMGIVYARSLAGDNDRFWLPEDWYAWTPTARHINPQALQYAESFAHLNVDSLNLPNQGPRLFYLWGHSFEFAAQDNWSLLDQLCETLGSKADTWYATNIEIYDYVEAYRSLQFSADGKRVFNPTLHQLWFKVNQTLYVIAPNETRLL